MLQIGLSTSETLLARLIRWFGKKQTGEALWSHAFLKKGQLVIEETPWGLRIKDYSKYNGVRHILYDNVYLGSWEEDKIWAEALKQVGTYKGLYGYAKFPLFALDALFGTYWFTQNIGTRHFKVCSQFVCWLFYKWGRVDLWKKWRSMTPDAIDDFLKRSSRFELVEPFKDNIITWD